MRMTNKLLAGAALMMAAFSFNQAQATSCAVPPTCAQLGYTMKKADCGEYPVMRCPFALTDDNQVFCEGTVKLAALPILYGDGTVSKKIISGKTPIGIIFDETNRLAVALTDVKADGTAGGQTMKWSINKYDIPNLENCTDSNTIFSCAVDGRANTDKILACGSGCGGTPAATAVNSYQPTGCSKDFCKKTKWFLPSMRDLNNIFQIKSFINFLLMSLIHMRVDELTEKGGYWSSNEVSNNGGWIFYMSNGNYNYIGGTNVIRPVVKY